MKKYLDKDNRGKFIVEYGGAKLRIGRTSQVGYSIHYYSAELLSGAWPDDNSLITLCDGDDPKTPHHFGGKVNKFGNKASVDVYVD